MVYVLMQICTCAFVWMVQYLKCRYLRFWSSDSNTSSVKQSDWMIISMMYKWNRLQGQKEEITKDLDKWTKQTYKTTELHKTNTTDDNTVWYTTSEQQVNRNSLWMCV